MITINLFCNSQFEIKLIRFNIIRMRVFVSIKYLSLFININKLLLDITDIQIKYPWYQ